MKTETILITGAGGFIGSHLSEALIEKGSFLSKSGIPKNFYKKGDIYNTSYADREQELVSRRN